MNKIENPNYPEFEQLLYSATKYIFTNPANPKSEDYYFATKIAGFWMNKDTGYSMPTFGKFFESLKTEKGQTFLNTASMMYYQLIQKIEHNRTIVFERLEGVPFSELKDVREVQLEGAKIFLDYAKVKSNNLALNSKTKKFLKAYNKRELEKIMFD